MIYKQDKAYIGALYKEITKMYKGTKITLRAKLYKAKQKAGQKGVNSRWGSSVAKLRNLRNLQVANSRNPAKLSLILPVLQHFCSKFPPVRSCIFEFGSGSLCLNRIEDNEVFVLQNYNNRATKCD